MEVIECHHYNTIGPPGSPGLLSRSAEHRVISLNCKSLRECLSQDKIVARNFQELTGGVAGQKFLFFHYRDKDPWKNSGQDPEHLQAEKVIT
jgi:hypothetical protein